MKKNEFKCEICKEVYEKISTEQEALTEFEEKFPEEIGQDLASVCDECYVKVLESSNKP